jgi:hypothetical protein
MLESDAVLSVISSQMCQTEMEVAPSSETQDYTVSQPIRECLCDVVIRDRAKTPRMNIGAHNLYITWRQEAVCTCLVSVKTIM